MSKFDSSTGWYVCSYLIRFSELDNPNINNEENKFSTWENTILIQAPSFDAAYDKAAKIAQDQNQPYPGGKNGAPVQWIFEGISNLTPIDEPLADGSELMWEDLNNRKLKTIRRWVKTKNDIIGLD